VGFSPLDEQLAIWDAHWSERLAALSVWLYGQVSGELTTEIFKQLTQLILPQPSVWRRAERWGQQIQAVEQHRQQVANALPLRGQAGPNTLRVPQTMGVGMDGTMICLRDEGWKELKIGTVFDVAVRPEPVEEGNELQDQAHAINNSYVGFLGEPTPFAQLLWSEAVRRHMPQAHDSVAIGDGAKWIWNLVQEHFSDSWQVVDWYHAKQHLYNAANLVLGEGSPAAAQWVKELRTPLYQGQVWQVVQSIRDLAAEYPSQQKALEKEASYFENNKRRMQYLEVRDAGLPIGSGMVESGCKQFGARFNGAGMRWSRAGAERLIPLRAAILSGRFDAVWQTAYNAPLN
jgi:hypothetical protein